VHDLGLLLTRQATAREVRRSPPGGAAAVVERYQQLLAAIAGSEALEDLEAAPLPEETLAVILARLLGDSYLRWTARPRLAVVEALPTYSPTFFRDRGALAREHDPAWALAFLQRLVEQERGVVARLEQIETSTLRLLGLFSLDPAAAGAGVDLAE